MRHLEGFRGGHGCAKGFTLVELLVVIAIIGTLIALLLPAVQAAREAARRSQCANNFKQVGVALHNYHSAHKCFPPGMYANPMPPNPSHFYYGWAAYILPFMEQQGLYDRIDFAATWSYFDNTKNCQNREVSNTKIEGFLCPSDPQGGEGIWVSPSLSPTPVSQCAMTNMCGVSDSIDWAQPGGTPKNFPDNDGVMGANENCSIRDISDGTSKTLMIGEVTGGKPGSFKGEFWAAWNICDTSEGINGPYTMPGGYTGEISTTGFSSFHVNGCHFTMADGSVQFLTDDIALVVLTQLTTRNGGEPVEVP
ncbi:MAG: DUF1559 domain-containing protein [Pirellulales bacterium]|nr:DUF1559 domain-containing protein [Pirellulales bacterium]